MFKKLIFSFAFTVLFSTTLLNLNQKAFAQDAQGGNVGVNVGVNAQYCWQNGALKGTCIGGGAGTANVQNGQRGAAYSPTAATGCSAVDSKGIPTFGNIGCLISNLTNNVVKMLAALFGASALTMFLWGLVMFIKNAGNDSEREKGKKFMMWGIVALFVMTSVWGIVRLGQTFLGIDKNQTQVALPTVCTNPNGCESKVASPSNPLGTGTQTSGSGSKSGSPVAGSQTSSGSNSGAVFTNRNSQNSCNSPLLRVSINGNQQCANPAILNNTSGMYSCTSDWVPFSGNDYRCTSNPGAAGPTQPQQSGSQSSSQTGQTSTVDSDSSSVSVECPQGQKSVYIAGANECVSENYNNTQTPIHKLEDLESVRVRVCERTLGDWTGTSCSCPAGTIWNTDNGCLDYTSASGFSYDEAKQPAAPSTPCPTSPSLDFGGPSVAMDCK